MNLEDIETLHELLEIAIQDFQKILLHDDYQPNMNNWHLGSGASHGRCEVCLAGSVIAMSLNMPAKKTYSPSDFNEDIGRRLEALNELRLGYIAGAYSALTDRRKDYWKALELSQKWNDRIPDEIKHAKTREQATELATYLQEMLIDLKAAGI